MHSDNIPSETIQNADGLRKELERVQDDKMELYRKAKDDKMAATEFKCRQDAHDARLVHELREYVRRSQWVNPGSIPGDGIFC
ncbi:hypothetical protein Pmar_PMAR015209 [Perkinsus marinus ATCC 50983]|uniref:Uncharacterized protein n=1 Tax=Perkinsus marinus (strain ATCC 50983 / TXsc) TaxID=423536 RepID=C5K5Q3_PERM5|nr:hypothetical protein Pmar_PMAR015209 [Perkinsus marinus ATCC 50983]EER20210.1 hypothetical protein Pmar_PMAR015209 [Perkinsus marinus ATCC 50983]|eukprot:XP_002788414.1 hypothetical protein Pmar_PMAR015209 [Perkinsus marinus ATCC 50983]